MANTQTTTELGTFSCVSGRLRVTDPCYDRGAWCAGVVDDCRVGKWTASVHRIDLDFWGNRVARLEVVHVDGGEGPEQEADFEVGVDSGQAGVFDAQHYDGGDEGGYEKWCELTVRRDISAGVRKYGAVSSSGLGDGGYTATIQRDLEGKCFRVSIEFIDERDASK